MGREFEICGHETIKEWIEKSGGGMWCQGSILADRFWVERENLETEDEPVALVAKVLQKQVASCSSNRRRIGSESVL